MTPTKKYLSLGAIALAGITFTACGDDDDTPTDGTTVAGAVGTVAPAGTAAAGTVAAGAATVAAVTVPSIPEEAQDAAADMVVQQLEAQGITITEEQASCLVENSSGLDPNDVNAMTGLVTTCGIDIAQLAGG